MPPPITDSTILEFLISTTSQSFLVVSSSSPDTTSSRIEKILNRRNIQKCQFPSSDFQPETNSNSGITNIIIATSDLQELLKQTETIRPRTVVISKESSESIENFLNQSNRTRGTVLIATDNNDSTSSKPQLTQRNLLLNSTVLVHNQPVKLSQLLPNTSESDIDNVLFSYGDFLSKLEASADQPVPLLGTLSPDPNVPETYMPRTFSCLMRLSPDVFTHGSDDIFVISGVTSEDLKSHFGTGNTVDSIQNQIEQGVINVKLVAAGVNKNDESGFESIAKLTSAPVHWVFCTKIDDNFMFEWISTKGSKQLIEQYMDLKYDGMERFASEEDLIPSSTHVSVRSRTYGFGTATLVNTLILKLRLAYPSRYVVGFRMSELLGMTGDVRVGAGLANQLVEHCRFLGVEEATTEAVQAAKKILKIMLTQRVPSVELVLRDWDGLSSEELITAFEVLKLIRVNCPGVRIWSFSVETSQDSKFYSCLDDCLGRTKNYRLLPLSYDDQVEFIKKNAGGNTISRVGVSLLNAIADLLNDEYSFTSFPLHLMELIEVCKILVKDEEDVWADLNEEERMKFLPSKLTLFLDICCTVIDTRRTEYFFDRAMKKGVFDERSEIQKFGQFHSHSAIKELVPEFAEILDEDHLATFPQEIDRYGICYMEGESVKFVHSAFAEVLCGRFVMSINSSDGPFGSREEARAGLLAINSLVLDAVKEKGLELLREIVPLSLSIGKIFKDLVAAGGGASLNCFRVLFTTLGALIGAELPGGVGASLARTPEGVEMFGELVRNGCYPVVKYLVMEKGFGVDFFKGKFWKFIDLTLKKTSDGDEGDVIRRKLEILKLFILVDSNLGNIVSEKFGGMEWSDVFREYEIKLVEFLNDEACKGELLKRVDRSKKTVFHGVAVSYCGADEFVKKLVRENIVDYSSKDRNSKTALELGFELGDLRFGVNIADGLVARGVDDDKVKAVEIYRECVARLTTESDSGVDIDELNEKINALSGKVDKSMSNGDSKQRNKIIDETKGVDVIKKKKKQIIDEAKGADVIKKKKKPWYRILC